MGCNGCGGMSQFIQRKKHEMLDWAIRQPHLFNHVSRWREPADIGLGDTLEHAFKALGADKFAAMLKVFRIDCGCADEKDYWNERRPYLSCPLSMSPYYVETRPEDALKQLTYAERNPATYPEKSLNLLAVTTINPREVGEQLKALASWQKFGLEIAVMNTEAEIRELQGVYPVDHWIAAERVAENGSILISDLVAVSAKFGRQILLMNSDIEIRGRQEQITERMDATSFLVGVRWNHHGDYDGRQFRYGIDAITLTPQQAALIPDDMPIPMGRPAWDYIIPAILIKAGYRSKVIHERLFWHKYHLQRWNNGSWERGMDWYAEKFGESRLDQEFRSKLDPGLSYNGYCYVDATGKRPCVR